MPGIACIYARTPSPMYERQAQAMVAAMAHTPACMTGTVFEPDLGVYAGIVAYEGSYAERQSATRPGAPTQLLLCGECFAPPGAATEALIVEQYEREGDRFVTALNGLFSGLLIDHARHRALLFNDRYGSERLYAAERNDALYVASEAKALLAVLPELRAFDDEGVAQFLAFGSTFGGHTLFRGMTLLPGATLCHMEAGAPAHHRRYFLPAQWETLAPLTPAAFEAGLAESLQRVLPNYLRADRAVGVSLTGGLDTRMIMACLPPATRRGETPQAAYTYACEGGERLLDLTLARRVAASCQLPHHTVSIGADFLRTFEQQLDRTVYVTDGCAGALCAHEIFLSERARRIAPIRLTGNYGSEILRSMSTFKRTGPRDEALSPEFSRKVHEVVARRQREPVHPVTHAAFHEVPLHLFGNLAAGRSQLTVRSPYLDNEIVALAYRAPQPSRRDAKAALHLIGRGDPALARIPTDRGLCASQPPLARLAQHAARELECKLDYWQRDGLPRYLTPVGPLLDTLARQGLLGRHKFLAYRSWFRAELADYARQAVSDAAARARPWWNPRGLAHLVARHVAGQDNHLPELHAVLTLEAVQRTLMVPR
jgi:asparagine synthase (glutamine-hydrolysing)